MALDTSPARYIGLVRASELDFEMMVLSRSKKAASIAPGMVGHGAEGPERPKSRRQRPLFGLWCWRRGTIAAAQKPTLRPAPSHGSSSTPPEEPCARYTGWIAPF